MKFRIKRNLHISIIIVLLGFILSCNEGIPRETIKWEEDGNGYIQYSTNDEDKFYTWSISTYLATDQADYSGTTFSFVRKNGPLGAPYGGVFCFQDSNNYYRILINGNGKYQIVSKVSGNFTYITPDWIDSADLLTGYNQINEIEIIRNTGTSDFTININGVLNEFYNNTDFDSGTSGFYTYILSNYTGEYFPYEANDTRFKITAPVAVP